MWCRDDVLGAQAAGLQGALVRTGKYRPEDEHRKGSLGNKIKTVLRIRNRRIRMLLGLLDPEPLVRGRDPDPEPSISKKKLLEKP